MSETQTRPMTVAEFRQWYTERPEPEHWELIDGECVMMTPPTIPHQRIASNLQRALDDALVAMNSPLSAYQRVGVNLDVERYDPEPDVVVINDAESSDGRYAGRFHLAAEIISESDDRRHAKKMIAYRRHPSCRHILLLQQEHVEIAYQRRDRFAWELTVFTGLDDVLRIDEFGLACPLSRIYHRVRLP